MLSACAGIYAPVVPPVGMTYNETAFPVDIEFGPNDIGPTKGMSKSESILGLVAWGDASVQSAAQKAGIKQIDHIDSQFFNVFGVYTKYEIIVWGKTAEQMPTPKR
jgi:hypothetical protein